jgi:cob(I)alamin adenosyltransferase
MNQFYTRAGDSGYTGLLGEGRVSKHDPRIEAVGSIDEATAAIGLGRAICRAAQTAPLLLTVQRDLYGLMAEVAATPKNAARFRSINPDRVAWLEAQVDATSQQVELPREFIVPGDSPAGAAMAVARTVVRRAERRVAQLFHEKALENAALLHYLNRLSSLLFVLELLENKAAGDGRQTLAKE